MRSHFIAVSAALLTFGAAAGSRADPITSQGDLGEVDLLQIMRLRLLHPKTDAFTGEYTSRYDGRHFKIDQTVRQENGPGYGETNARWAYSLSSKQLGLYLIDGFTSKGIEFYYKSSVLGHYVGRTALGAQARVTAYNETSGTIVPTNDYGSRPQLKIDLNLPPEEARALVANLRLEVEGDLAAVDGVTTSCDHTKTDGSLDNPNAFVSFECRLNARITRVAFIDLRSRHVVAEWPTIVAPKITSSIAASKPAASLPAPVVKTTYPASGSTISSGTLVLKVAFDQAMSPDSWEFAKLDGADLPACLSRPRLLPDRRTFVMLCSTVAGRSYGVKMNVQSAEGRAVTKELTFATSANGEQVRAVSDAITAAGLTSADSPIASR